MYIVNTSTSIVPIPTGAFAPGESALVYLSSTTDAGQLVTVFDIDGALSTPQSIIISTTSDTSLGPGLSSVTIQQGFGYVTLRSGGGSKWSVVNENAFPVAAQGYSMRGIQFTTLNVSDLLAITSTVTVSTLNADSITAQSSASIAAPLFTSSIIVNDYASYLTGLGKPYPYFQADSASNLGSCVAQSSFSVAQQATLLSDISTIGPLFVQGNMNMAGSYHGSNAITIQSSFSTTQRILVDSNITVGRLVQTGSNITCFTNVQTSSMVTQATQATVLTTDEFVFFNGSLRPLLSVAPVALTIQPNLLIPTSFLQVSTLRVSDLSTGSIVVGSTIDATLIPTLSIPNATIQNPSGSLIVSSIVTGDIVAKTLYGLNYTSTVATISTHTSLFSTLYSANSLYAAAGVSTVFSITDSFAANSMVVDILDLGGQAPLQMNTFALSSLHISTAFLANQMSSFTTAAGTLFDATGAIFETARMVCTGPVVTSTLQLIAGIAASGSLYLSTPSVTFSTANITAASALTTGASSLYTMGAQVGAPLNYSTTSLGAPYMYGSTVSGLSADTASEFIIGIGTPWSPFHVVATNDRVVDGFLQNPSSTLQTYMNLSYTYMTNGTTVPGSASIVMGNPIVQSTIVTISSSLIAPNYQHFSLQNYSVDPKVVSSVVQYYLTGPETYSAPSILLDQQTILAAGLDQDTVTKFAYSSDGGTTWTTLPFVGMENACNGIAWGYDKWVAVGQGATDTIMYSYTGTVWYGLGSAVLTGGGNGVARGASLWVAVADGTNTIAYSYDGISWIGVGATIFSSGVGVATNGASWVACGHGSNTLANSPDGITWTGQGTSVFSVSCNGVASNGSLWVAVGFGTNDLATSTNGLTWVGQTVFGSVGNCVAWNGAQWLAGASGSPSIAYSSNGLVWTTVACPLTTVYNVAWSGTQWVAMGTGPSLASVAVSPNGIVWTVTATALFSEGFAIGNRTVPSFIVQPTPIFVATGQGGTALATSPDGATWTPRTSPFTTATTAVAWNEKIWVAGGSGTYAVAYSLDGILWTGVTFANFAAAAAVAYGKTGWIAVGTGTAGYTRAQSADGISWTQVVSTSGNFFSGAGTGITWSQGIWVATGTPQGSGILFSLTGSAWIPQLGAIFTTGGCVASNGAYFLAGGAGGPAPLAYSVEGSVWSAVAPGIFTSVTAVAWGSRLWVATGQGPNTLAYSYDGVKWYGLGAAIFSVQGSSVAWNGVSWVATGQGAANTLATSPDGITWTGQGAVTFSVQGNGVTATPLPNTTVNREEPVAVRWNLLGPVQISPTVIEKPPRTNQGWDSRAASADGFVPSAFLQFKPAAPNAYCMAGLTENPTATVGFSALNYAFCLTDGGLVQIFELGVQVASVGTYAPLDVFQILFDGSAVTYLQNSATVRVGVRPVGPPLYFGSSFNNAGTRLVDVEFHPQYLLNTVAPVAPYTYTTINPAGFTSDPLVFSRPVTESVLLPALWQFQAPLSGTLLTPSSQVYGELFVGGSRIFSTPTLQNPFAPLPSTYTLSYLLTSNVSVTPGATMEFHIRTQRGLGITAMFSTTLTESIYNLSSTQFVQLIHSSSNLGQQTSDLSVWLANVSTAAQTYVNSNSGIEMNSGFMRWNNRQYGLTIQNQYNDLQTRTLTYTGSLFTASDSNLKHDIEYADSATLYQSIKAIPLNRYALSDQFRGTFRTQDAHQLGVLTTNVAKEFPAMIHPVESEHLGLSNLETVDRVQFRYAHLGATQHLMGRVSTLSGQIEERLKR